MQTHPPDRQNTSRATHLSSRTSLFAIAAKHFALRASLPSFAN
ncbi:hypothetical protein [Methylomonas albis]|nr:hypothetical protein [Methylomonas albis]